MSSRRHSYGPSKRSGDEKPLLPPIREWFPDDPPSSSSSNTHRAYRNAGTIPNGLRGMPPFPPPPPPPPPPPGQPFPSPQHSRPHFYNDRPGPHGQGYHPNLDVPQSFAYPPHMRATSSEHHVESHGAVMSQHMQRAGTHMHYRSHDFRPMSDVIHPSSSQEPGPGYLLRPERYDPSQPGRSSPSSKYECPYCRKYFNRPSSLKTHLNTHTGEKPFICPHEGCGRAFSVQSNMRRHARVHTQFHSAISDDGSGEDDTETASSATLAGSSSRHTSSTRTSTSRSATPASTAASSTATGRKSK